MLPDGEAGGHDLITFAHILNTGNTGDIASGPYHYFDLGPHRVLNHDTPLPDGPLVVGGGTMVNWLQGGRVPTASPKVAWGIGSSRHGLPDPWIDPQGFDLLGIREWSSEREAAGTWTPCVSCMLPLLDRPRPPTREAARFLNADPSIRSRYQVVDDDIPTMTNAAPLERIIGFLASAEVVVTDSYHGVYWATLLGRRVVCVAYSSKFYGFRCPPAYSENRGADWRERAKDADVYPDALEMHRAATEAFAERARAVLT